MSSRIFNPPNETQTARLMNGLLTSVFPGKPYPRKLTYIQVEADSIAKVDVYVGAIAAPSRIAGNPFGQKNEAQFLVPKFIPAGHILFVVWNTATGSAVATISTEAAT